MINKKDIEDAHIRIKGITIETPLIPYHGRPVHSPMYFKPENLQPIGAFKLRGAYNKLASLSAEERIRGVIAYSSGNHAQGVAYSARELGIHATIVMPDAAPPIKIENTRNLGANVKLIGKGDEKYRQHIAEEMAEEYGYVIVPPFDDAMIMAGQGTVGLEIYKQCEDVTHVMIPIGGGGLISGVSTYLKQSNPSIQIIGVEPELGNDTQLSMESGAITSIPTDQAISSIADGLRVSQPGDLTFPLVKEYVDTIVTVSENDIIQATKKIIKETRLMVEPSGAVSFAAWLNHLNEFKSTDKTICIISGGNIDPTLLNTLLKPE